MAPLLPSESVSYVLKFPNDSQDQRLNLNTRTGAGSTYTNSTIIIHGGLTIGLELHEISIKEFHHALQQYFTINNNIATNIFNYLSNEIFYLHIITKEWKRVEIPDSPNVLKPCPRLYHSITFHSNHIYIFGGLCLNPENNKDFTVTNDLWDFDTESNTWSCLGSNFKNVSPRLGATLSFVNVNSEIPTLLISGGRDQNDEKLDYIDSFNLLTKQFSTRFNLNSKEPSFDFNSSDYDDSSIDPKFSKPFKDDGFSKYCCHELNFILTDNSSSDNNLYLYSEAKKLNPIISLPLIENSTGSRFNPPSGKNPSSIPSDLFYPSGGIFGSNIIVSGHNLNASTYQVFLFNIPSGKWTRLNTKTKSNTEAGFWKCFSWPSHHKLILLGSKDFIFPTIQKFDLLVTLGLPITNIFHAFQSKTKKPFKSTTSNNSEATKSSKSTSFEAYSNYIAPTTKISSIRSVFPSHAVTLGRNAFERFGSSLGDFDFMSADGDKVPVSLVVLRKRWGRCFDMLFSKGYCRAVHELENQQDGGASLPNDDNLNDELNSLNKKSVKLPPNRLFTSEVPQFRLPFQDSPKHLGISGNNSKPGSRKASVVSGSSINSGASSSIYANLDHHQQAIAFKADLLPPLTDAPTDSLPMLDKSPRSSNLANSTNSLFKTPIQSLRDSPRGSVSGNSISSTLNSSPSGSFNAVNPQVKVKDLKYPVNNLNKRSAVAQVLTRATSFQNSSGTPETPLSKVSTSNSTSTSPLEASMVSEEGAAPEQEPVANSDLDEILDDIEEHGLDIEPLLIPRCLYLPFSTTTVSAFAEFLFTGQLGDKWLLAPTTLDVFLIAKFYEVPLLYDLISEALYAIIGKKEDWLIKEYGKLLKDYDNRLKVIFKNDEQKIQQFFHNHHHVKELFDSIESLLNSTDDGYLNLNLFRKESKSDSIHSHHEGELGYSLMFHCKHNHAIRRSRLSKEFNAHDAENEKEPIKDSESAEVPEDDVDEDDEDDENENDDDMNDDVVVEEDLEKGQQGQQKQQQQQHEDDDPLSTKQNPGLVNPVEIGSLKLPVYDKETTDEDKDDEDDSVDPLSKKSSKSSSSKEIQVPEGRFHVSKDILNSGKTVLSSSDNDEEKKSSTATDSDDLGVGIGLVNEIKMENRKPSSASPPTTANSESFKNEVFNDSELPILLNLASPDSPAPSNYLIQIIYEASALACDMKLLLRTINVLEISKILKNQREELLSELDEVERMIKADEEMTDSSQDQTPKRRETIAEVEMKNGGEKGGRATKEETDLDKLRDEFQSSVAIDTITSNASTSSTKRGKLTSIKSFSNMRKLSPQDQTVNNQQINAKKSSGDKKFFSFLNKNRQ